MAKKKENQLTYGQMPLPSSTKAYRVVKKAWHNLNYRQKIDTGALSMERNISTVEAPYLTPSKAWEVIYESDEKKGTPVGIFGFEDFLIILHSKKKALAEKYEAVLEIGYITEKGDVFEDSYVKEITQAQYEDDGFEIGYPRNMIQFNVYDNPTDPVAGGYVKKLLTFPDRISMNYVKVKYFTHRKPGTPPKNASVDYYQRNQETSVLYAWDKGKEDWVEISIEDGVISVKDEDGNLHIADKLQIYSTDESDIWFYEFPEGATAPPENASKEYYWCDTKKSDDWYYAWDIGKSQWMKIKVEDEKILVENGEAWRDADCLKNYDAGKLCEFTSSETPPGSSNKKYYWKNKESGIVYKWNENTENWVEVDIETRNLYIYEYDEEQEKYVSTGHKTSWLKSYVPDTTPPEGADKNACWYNTATKDFYIWKNEKWEIKDFWEVLGVRTTNDPTEIKTLTLNHDAPTDSQDKTVYWQNRDTKTIYAWNEEKKKWVPIVPVVMPDVKYATTHLSRIFGVSKDRIYASGFNDYANWALDTIGDSNEANAWCTVSQSNTKAGGDFTGITTFLNHVVCFKKDFMHEVYNTKNPFRLQDIYAEGAIDNRTIQDVDGKLIFVSEDNVKVYTGSNPRILSYNIGFESIEKAVSGTDGRFYYLYCTDSKKGERIYCWDSVFDAWSEMAAESAVVGFTRNDNGMYALCENGCIYKLDGENYAESWAFETDLMTNNSVDVKHIRKIQMFAHIEEGSKVRVYVLYDDEEFSENSHLVFDSERKGKTGQVAIRCKPRNTAGYGIKLHIEGEGFVRLYEAELVMEQGGDLYS